MFLCFINIIVVFWAIFCNFFFWENDLCKIVGVVKAAHSVLYMYVTTKDNTPSNYKGRFEQALLGWGC